MEWKERCLQCEMASGHCWTFPTARAEPAPASGEDEREVCETTVWLCQMSGFGVILISIKTETAEMFL